MKVAFVNAEGNARNPSEFTAKDIELAVKQGCLLQTRFSETMKSNYLANVCVTCKAFIGENFMSSYWNNVPELVLPAGLCCFECERDFPELDW